MLSNPLCMANWPGMRTLSLSATWCAEPAASTICVAFSLLVEACSNADEILLQTGEVPQSALETSGMIRNQASFPQFRVHSVNAESAMNPADWTTPTPLE